MESDLDEDRCRNVSNMDKRVIDSKTSLKVSSDCLQLIQPNGGEEYSGVEPIEYSMIGCTWPFSCCGTMWVFLKRPGGDWFVLGQDVSGSNGYILWDTTPSVDGQYLMKIQAWLDCDCDGVGEQPMYQDVSDDWFTVRNAPYQPAKPIGITEGKPGKMYTFESSTTDPTSDDICYLFDWGDGSMSDWTEFYESGETVKANHSWEDEKTYQIKVKAKDRLGKESEWSDPLELKIINNPPEKPTLTGPSEGKTGVEYTFNVTTNDPDGDDVFYLFDWYTEVDSEWRGPYESEDMCSATHVFHEDGSYVVKVKAKDGLGEESDWARLEVEMPKTKWESSWLFNFFEHYLELSSFLKSMYSWVEE